jgi:predicted DNA-binding transcriptional regulator AlpA
MPNEMRWGGQAYRDEVLASRGDLLSRTMVTVVLDLPPESEEMDDDGFPRPIMWWRGEHWAKSDIRAYREGRRFHGQGERSVRDEYMDATEVADYIDLERSKLVQRLKAAKPDYYKVPPPAGRTGKAYYWKRADVKSWLERFKARETKRRSIVLGRPQLRKRGLRRRKRNEPEEP